jgi:hypothetical protein
VKAVSQGRRTNRCSYRMTSHLDDKPTQEPPELRGWSFFGAIVLATVLGGGYVLWKYYKHHVLFPSLGTDMWVIYALGVAGFWAWGVATRFGTKR